MQRITFTEHVRKSQPLLSSKLNEEFISLMAELITCTKIIQKEISHAGLSGTLGITGEFNVQGEKVQKLDDLADKILIEKMIASKTLYAIGSEEQEKIIICEKGNRGAYILYFDPLDGSSNIDVNVSIGTIFSIYKIDDKKIESEITESELIPIGREQVCAGYVLYGPSTVLVYTVGDGAHAFTYDTDKNEFLLSNEDIIMPKVGSYYSVNTGNENIWDNKTKEAVNYFTNANYSMRYVGSLVADFHRTLLKGGVYLYPRDTKQKEGKLRLVYEAAPLSFIAEQARGGGIDGKEDILDIKPSHVHARTPLIIGSQLEISKINTILNKD